MTASSPFPDETELTSNQLLLTHHNHSSYPQTSLLALAYDAMIVRDEAGIILSWNPGAEQLYGWSEQEALGKLNHDLLQTHFPIPQEELEGHLLAGNLWEGEINQTHKHGQPLIVESRQIAIRTPQNASLTFIEVNRDITSHKQREEARLQLAALVESANIPIISKTREGIITSWNQAAGQMYGYSAEEAIGQPVTLIFPADRQDEFVRIMERISRGERVDLYETTRQRKDGTIVPISVTISPIYDKAGQIIGASDIAHDITERKRVETQERFLTQVSKSLSSSLDYQQTLTNIAHLAVPQLADWFMVDLIDATGHFELIEITHNDPEQVRWARKLREQYPIDPDAPLGVARVARTGQAELYADISDEILTTASRTPEQLALARQVGYSSAMLVPLVTRGETIGIISFVATESGKKYDERDLALAEEVGRRAGIALDNARLYREVRHSRDQLDVILQGVADGILVYNRESQIMYANEAAAQMTGYTSVQQMLSTHQSGILNKYTIINEQGQPFPLSQLTHLRVLAGEAEAQAIIGYREQDSDQPERWSLVKSRPVYDESSNTILVITIIHDITERMRVERRKDEFISMASHELKTPVTSLKGFTNVLQRRLKKQDDTQGLYYLTRMDAQLDKLTALIADLLDLSRMQSGKFVFRPEPFDLDKLIEETVENVQASTSTHQLLIDGRTNARVMGDKERLGQVFINLLTNAIKYSPKAEKVLIRLTCAPDSHQAIICVQDFGIGIDPTHHKKIFERFYQVTDPAEKTYPGLGIGLYISSDIVTRHQGHLWVESNKGKGASFFVALPLLSATEQTEHQS